MSLGGLIWLPRSPVTLSKFLFPCFFRPKHNFYFGSLTTGISLQLDLGMNTDLSKGNLTPRKASIGRMVFGDHKLPS
jgi:hypothetical protein